MIGETTMNAIDFLKKYCYDLECADEINIELPNEYEQYRDIICYYVWQEQINMLKKIIELMEEVE